MSTRPETFAPPPPVAGPDSPIIGGVERANLMARMVGHEPSLTAPQAGAVLDLMASLGIIVEGVPPCRKVLMDAQTFAERTILAELIARLFRFYVLGSIVLPDTPAAMDWLKSFMDGANGQGPLGAGPMLWPRLIPSAVRLLTDWGFEPTPSEPPYVIKRRPGDGAQGRPRGT